ncbi:MAG: hypothetical protein M3155_05750 [Actinomycetota bacterium]|nr:hypothetical protein [Actinomycetota bacterium]
MRRARLFRMGAVAAAGAAVGFGVSALGTAGADTAKRPGHRAAAHRGAFAGPARRALGGAVHAEAVIPVNGRFATVTLDRGFIQKVDGNDLTIREGTKTLTYRTVTLTIPANARVRDDRKAAKLSDLVVGEHVLVVQGPNRTLVRARHKPGA